MHYFTLDLEMNPTNQRLSPKLKREIIEIGVAQLDETDRVSRKFQCFVLPEFGTVTPHIVQLTGINQAVLSRKGKLLRTAIAEFSTWLGQEPCTIYTWSNMDAMQLYSECRRKKLAVPKNIEWVDLQREFQKQFQLDNVYGLTRALEWCGRTYQGNAHQALSDAVNTAQLVQAMHHPEEVEKLHLPYASQTDPPSGNAIADKYGDLLRNYIGQS